LTMHDVCGAPSVGRSPSSLHAPPHGREWHALGRRGGSPLGALNMVVHPPGGGVGLSAPPLAVDWLRFEASSMLGR
jgi:hypothetical protein